MDHTQASITSAQEALENTFGGRWGVWLSDTGRWWASRRGSLSAADLTAGAVPFLRADTPEELAERIEEQETLFPLSGGSTVAGAGEVPA
ncbi:MAG: hypothetical protein ACRDNF_02350 [Streptosporangiaceae bacterium]